MALKSVPNFFSASDARGSVLNTGPGLWVVEVAVFAVRRFARYAAAEVTRRNRLPIPFVGQQLNEPGLMFDLFVQNPGCHVIGPGILAEGHVTNSDPAPDSAALRFQQHG